MTSVQRAFAVIAQSQMPAIPGVTRNHPTQAKVDQATAVIRSQGTPRKVRLLNDIIRPEEA